ncbi:hypothetical protein [Thauera sp. 28]|uniref:hypothetical protein n=1 Tax=Thauera sp. 28 TaxID=303682 RepID=UPI000309A5B9|nr:hypothetical protein [Thauera sp. 28]
MAAPTAHPAHCASCAHFSRPAADRLVAVSGFGRCAHHATGHYVSPAVRFGCRFHPARWRAA